MLQETLIEYCLQALLSHSTVEEQCAQLIASLPTFNMILQVTTEYVQEVLSIFNIFIQSH